MKTTGKYSKLFEGVDLTDTTPMQMFNTKKLYDYIIESVDLAKEEKCSPDEVMDEGLLSGLLTGGIAAAVGPAVAKSVCKCLGISEDGPLGKLICSPLVMGSIGYTLGS